MHRILRSLSLLCAGTAAGIVIATSSSAFAEKNKSQALPIEDVQLFAEVFGAIKNYYVDDVSDKKLIENAIKGMVDGLDPHSSFLDIKAFKDLEESTAGEFGGLGLEVTKDPSGVRVVSPIDDTPAARAGVRAGDIIVKIDDKATADLTLDENVKLMRGKPKTAIVLTIARKGVTKPITLKLVRDIIKIQSVRSKALDQGLGYIRISQFQERTSEDVAAALTKLQASGNTKGLVLDLRNNPGGLLNAAIGVSAAFLPAESLVVSTRGRDPQSEHKFIADIRDYGTGNDGEAAIAKLPPELKKIPLVVLINPASASASEIVAGALQDHKRATIMGTRSFGKGSVQTILPLKEENGQTTGIKITTARYYTPSGRTIQATGITPDIAVDDTPQGNYPSFNVRESELANHIEVEQDKSKKAANDNDEDNLVDTQKVLDYHYVFGDDKDFPLLQAKAQLLGQKVVTHADVVAQLKEAKKQKDAKEAAASKDDKSSK